MAKAGESRGALAKRLGISRGTLYYQKKIPEKDEELRRAIEALHLEHPGYGYRRVAIALEINAKRAQRVMKKYCIRPLRRAQKPKKTGDLGRGETKRVDILSKWSPIEPNIVWVSDFTFIRFHGRFIYLATVLDSFTGEVLGSNISFSHDAKFVLKAIQRARTKARTLPEWFHSDQGSEFCSDDVAGFLECNGVNISNTPKGSPWKNPSQESFYGRFKVEFGDFERFDTVEELIEEIYAKVFYFSELRIKTKLKMPPAEFRRQWFQEQEKLATANQQDSTTYESPPLKTPLLTPMQNYSDHDNGNASSFTATRL